jgi:hypothetical protein
MRERIIFAICVLALLVGIAWTGDGAMAGDVVTAGRNDMRNAMVGELNYTREQCFDGTNWDGLAGQMQCILPVDMDTGAGTDYHEAVGVVYAGNGGHTLVDATHPLPVVTSTATAAAPGYVQAIPLKFAGTLPANCKAITDSSQQFTFVASTYYQVCTSGNSAKVLLDTNPTATTSVGTGYDFIVSEGTCTPPFLPTKAKAAFIMDAAGGVICFKAYVAI